MKIYQHIIFPLFSSSHYPFIGWVKNHIYILQKYTFQNHIHRCASFFFFLYCGQALKLGQTPKNFGSWVQRKVSSTFAAETLFLLAALLGQVIKVEAVVWIPTKFQLGDCLTKGASIRGLLQTINPGMFASTTNF